MDNITTTVFAACYLSAMVCTLLAMGMSAVWMYRRYHVEKWTIHESYRHMQDWNIRGIAAAVIEMVFLVLYEVFK